MGRWLAELFLRLNGWQTEGQTPEAKKFVLIAAPHTSNWDLAYLLAMAVRFDIKPRWMGKHTLFRGPMGTVMRALGGIPIRRHLRENVVDQMKRTFDENEVLALTIPPEGTRGHTDHWKSGFYHIAVGAGVPLVFSYLDFGRKVGGIGPTYVPTGDVKADMDVIRAFYRDMQGRSPEDFGPIRLKEEEDQPPAIGAAPLSD
ncbi:MAG: acyltransferase [Myxococcales bacterium]|nr:acyltransferase [Myxococcales bacterium]